jgi:hypothetical protein
MLINFVFRFFSNAFCKKEKNHLKKQMPQNNDLSNNQNILNSISLYLLASTVINSIVSGMGSKYYSTEIQICYTFPNIVSV